PDLGRGLPRLPSLRRGGGARGEGARPARAREGEPVTDLATCSRRAAPLLALLLAAPLGGPAAAQPAQPAPEPLLDPVLDHGDPAAAQEALLRALEADPRDPRVPYALSALRNVV